MEIMLSSALANLYRGWTENNQVFSLQFHCLEEEMVVGGAVPSRADMLGVA